MKWLYYYLIYYVSVYNGMKLKHTIIHYWHSLRGTLCQIICIFKQYTEIVKSNVVSLCYAHSQLLFIMHACGSCDLYQNLIIGACILINAHSPLRTLGLLILDSPPGRMAVHRVYISVFLLLSVVSLTISSHYKDGQKVTFTSYCQSLL